MPDSGYALMNKQRVESETEFWHLTFFHRLGANNRECSPASISFMSESQPELQQLLRFDTNVETTPVYPIIHMIRADITYFIDTPLSYEALTTPDITYTLIQPLVEKYLAIQRKGNMSVVFCFLLNRVHFIRDDNLLTASLSRSRAELCEILAIRTFRDYGNSMLQLALVLTTSWLVYNGADPHILSQAKAERDDDLEDRVGNAIELAIIGKAKRFIKSSSCQKVINAIWAGKCVYQAESSHSILSDTYKKTPIHFYDPHKAPLLDHYRLKVPSIRSVLEYLNFLILFVLFIVAIEVNEKDRLNTAEIAFMVYALGFTLEKIAAMQEHGIKVYFKGTWNGFDLAFVTTFCIYAVFRLYGVYHDNAWAREMGIDCLALIACLLFPRLAFVTLKNNLMVLSLRAMMMQFVVLMLIAAFCFCGFLYALWTLSRNQAGYGAGTIAWWMLDLWFGLDASGFDRATQFHPLFGPVLMVTYACLSNTLLLTVLVSILSNTFATINEDAAAEAMFRKAVSTIEGVKADSLFSYQPPINLLALCVMLPASYLLSPRWFHKVNVFMIRATSFPILILIALYERQSKISGTTNFYDTMSAVLEKVFDTLPRNLKRMSFFEGLAGSSSDIDAIFEIEDEFESALDTREDDHDLQQQRQRRTSSMSGSPPNQPPSPSNAMRMRLNSMVPRAIDSLQSPLAQVFQPLVVTDTIPEESSQGSPTQTSLGVSYGPASRRRLSSIQSSAKKGEEPLASQAQSNAMRNFPLLPKPSLGSVPLSKSPEGLSGGGSPTSMATEGRTPEIVIHEHPTDTSEWGMRMDQIERRQGRIEDLLVQIAQDIKGVKPTEAGV
ncbi:receptor-activated Ca2+-permeable cation channel [Collybia nuda]|uniref:Receptor-activated Ca2+-permeable cation channel n=1 Tax=Collybia nuda TaxID=64659 RepID=A0A9P5YCB9_9AGAR|nr:receptor-activated Ca2+-permeable cation channel [Collybia nuda]